MFTHHFLIISTVMVLVNASRQRILSCDSDDGLSCKCAITGRRQITLLNCTTSDKWTLWSNWSSCERTPVQRRRRRCENPLVNGTNCVGEKLESRRCNRTQQQQQQVDTAATSTTSTVPEFVWGSWTDWNEWGMCSCPANQRQRIRHCIGHSCSGCNVSYADCERPCVTERWWSDWSEWVRGRSSVRFRSWCSIGPDGRSLTVVQLNESTHPSELAEVLPATKESNKAMLVEKLATAAGSGL